LLVTITGANVGKTAIVATSIAEAYVSQHVALIRLNEPSNSRFLHLWLTSDRHGRRRLLEEAYGAGKPGLSLDNLRRLEVWLPPLDEQNEIVNRTQDLLFRANEIEARIATERRRLEALAKAILAKAMQGELVVTEAELARREGRSYEPAYRLLGRIDMRDEASGRRARAGRCKSRIP
jgi:type I restriction enzyme S subunit